MTSIPNISGKNLVRLLQRLGFEVTRTKGSHFRMWHSDGRVTTVPVHQNKDLPKGLLRKIIRDDLQLSVGDFAALL